MRYLNFSKFVSILSVAYHALRCIYPGVLLPFLKSFWYMVHSCLWRGDLTESLWWLFTFGDHSSIFVSGTDFPGLAYNRFLEYVCLRCFTCFPALSKELEDGRASVHIHLCCYFVCIAYFWFFCRSHSRATGWNGSSWWQDPGGSTAWAGDRTIWPHLLSLWMYGKLYHMGL